MPVEGANLIDEDKASNAAGDDALPEPDSLPYLTSTMRTDLIQARRRSPCRDRTLLPGAAWLKPQDQGFRGPGMRSGCSCPPLQICWSCKRLHFSRTALKNRGFELL